MKTKNFLLKISIFILIISITGNIYLFYLLQMRPSETISVIYTDGGEISQSSKESYYIQKLYELFTKEELVQIAQKQWECKISINGKELSSNNVYLKTRDIHVVIAELAKPDSPLPEEILKLGTIDALQPQLELTDFIEVYSPVPYTISRKEMELGIKYSYDFKDVPLETMITFQLGPLIKEKFINKEKLTTERFCIVNR